MEEQTPSAPTISFSDIMMNVFASPADAYEGIRTSPSRASVWVVPMIVVILLSCAYTWTMFSNEAIKSQFMDARREALQEQVQSGKIDRDKANEGMDQLEKAGGMLIVGGVIAVALITPIMLFVIALVLWLIGKFLLKADLGYAKYLELWGAAQWIGALGVIVTILLMVGLSSMYATPSAALAILGSFKPHNTVHKLLASINVFLIWQLIVAGIGMAKYAGKPNGTGFGVGIGLFVLWTLLSVFGSAALGM